MHLGRDEAYIVYCWLIDQHTTPIRSDNQKTAYCSIQSTLLFVLFSITILLLLLLLLLSAYSWKAFVEFHWRMTSSTVECHLTPTDASHRIACWPIHRHTQTHVTGWWSCLCGMRYPGTSFIQPISIGKCPALTMVIMDQIYFPMQHIASMVFGSKMSSSMHVAIGTCYRDSIVCTNKRYIGLKTTILISQCIKNTVSRLHRASHPKIQRLTWWNAANSVSHRPYIMTAWHSVAYHNICPRSKISENIRHSPCMALMPS